jgi:hypothetical protein
VNEPAQSEGTRPSVLAIGVTPLQATQAYEALLEVVPKADLRVQDDPATRDSYARYSDRVRFVALDPRDPIESQLLGSFVAHANEVEELLSRSPETSRFIDPFSAVVVVANPVGKGAAEDDPVSPIARLVRRLRQSSSSREKSSSALARLLEGLGRAYGGGFPGPVLLEIPTARITLVAEPGLAPEAIRLAEQLVTIPGAGRANLPLRWSGDLQQWVPLEEDWSEQAALRRLAMEIQAKLPPKRETKR